MVVPALAILLMPLQDSEQPSTAAGWKKIGIASAAHQKLDAALPAFAKACELDPAEDDACYFLARTLHALDRWDEAREPFEKALRAASKPKLARVHRAIALNSIALGNSADAERHFKQAVALNPGPEQLPEDPRIDYGAFLFRQGRLAEALPLLRQAVKAVPRSARAHTDLGRVLLHLDKPGAAATSLEEAVRLEPRGTTARFLLGRAYLQLGRIEDGQKQLHLAREGRAADGSSTVR